jgi:hypothetical protein
VPTLGISFWFDWVLVGAMYLRHATHKKNGDRLGVVLPKRMRLAVLDQQPLPLSA